MGSVIGRFTPGRRRPLPTAVGARAAHRGRSVHSGAYERRPTLYGIVVDEVPAAP
jgi:hypothetical protein